MSSYTYPGRRRRHVGSQQLSPVRDKAYLSREASRHILRLIRYRDVFQLGYGQKLRDVIY